MPVLIFTNIQETLFEKEDYQKSSKILTAYLFSNPVSFYGTIIKNNRGLELVNSPFLG